MGETHSGGVMDKSIAHSPELAAKIAQAAPYFAALIEIFSGGTAAPSPADMLPEAEACKYGGCSKRTLTVARRTGEITAYGSQRDRSYRRSDLDKWIESRKVVHEPIDDPDIERRVERMAKARKSKAGK